MIRLSENFRIDIDPLNCTLQERKINKNGEEYWYNDGYYSTLDGALRGYLNTVVASKLDEDTWMLADLKETIKESLENALEDFKKEIDKL